MDHRNYENLSERQLAYVYATYKQGRLDVRKDDISLLYYLGGAISESEYEKDEISQILANLRSIIGLIAINDFDGATLVIRNLSSYIEKQHGREWDRQKVYARRGAYQHARETGRYVKYGTRHGGCWHMGDGGYMGSEGMDELGIDMHDLGYDW